MKGRVKTMAEEEKKDNQADFDNEGKGLAGEEIDESKTLTADDLKEQQDADAQVTPEASVLDLLDDFVNGRDIIDWDIECPDELSDDNVVTIKVVYDENGDEHEVIYTGKIVLDEKQEGEEE
jgi:hypothetical protein